MVMNKRVSDLQPELFVKYLLGPGLSHPCCHGAESSLENILGNKLHCKCSKAVLIALVVSVLI